MSAGSARQLAFESARMPLRTACTPLRLVASDGLLRPDERALAASRSATRLTRRGRLAVTVMATIAVATLALLLATSVDAAAPEIDHATTVLAGQTLSEVAATQLPTLPVRDAVARIQLANDLNTSQVHSGQSLLIPVAP